MQIIDLRRQQGNFQTSPHGLPEGYRTLSLWRYTAPAVGDLVIIARPQPGNPENMALYQVRTAPQHDFTGSDSNSFWTGGLMIDVIRHNLLTKEIVNILSAVGVI